MNLGAMLYVTNVERSVNFYQSLGFEFKGYWDSKNHRVEKDYVKANSPDYAEVHLKGTPLGLHRADAPTSSGFMLRLRADQIGPIHKDVTAAGASPTPKTQSPWGEWIFEFHDPDGHQWAVTASNE